MEMNTAVTWMKYKDKKLIEWYFALIMGAENAKSLWMHRRKSFRSKLLASSLHSTPLYDIPSLVSAREVHLRNAWKLHRHVSTMQRPSSMSSSKRQLRWRKLPHSWHQQWIQQTICSKIWNQSQSSSPCSCLHQEYFWN